MSNPAPEDSGQLVGMRGVQVKVCDGGKSVRVTLWDYDQGAAVFWHKREGEPETVGGLECLPEQEIPRFRELVAKAAGAVAELAAVRLTRGGAAPEQARVTFTNVATFQDCEFKGSDANSVCTVDGTGSIINLNVTAEPFPDFVKPLRRPERRPPARPD